MYPTVRKKYFLSWKRCKGFAFLYITCLRWHLRNFVCYSSSDDTVVNRGSSGKWTWIDRVIHRGWRNESPRVSMTPFSVMGKTDGMSVWKNEESLEWRQSPVILTSYRQCPGKYFVLFKKSHSQMGLVLWYEPNYFLSRPLETGSYKKGVNNKDV